MNQFVEVIDEIDDATKKYVLKELDWLIRIIEDRSSSKSNKTLDELLPPLPDSQFEYGAFIIKNQLNLVERLTLALSLLPHIDPSKLYPLLTFKEESLIQRDNLSGVILATGFTVLHLASNSRDEKLDVATIFEPHHIFHRKSVVSLGQASSGYPELSGTLNLSPSYVSLFLYNSERKPKFSNKFPASLITTKLNWKDLILNKGTENKLTELKNAIMYKDKLVMEHGVKHIKQGVRVLFYGPSGTGKTLTAALLGKELDRDVYRVDLSAVISKYIGETSKNLGDLFNAAEHKDWILFFDEGDALFGKRTDASKNENSNAHYANQDIAYLLQRIEDFNGMIILASNFHKNMDDAFYRRIEHSIYFPVPDKANRQQLWNNLLPQGFDLPPSHSPEILSKHNITAATIARIYNRVCINTLANQSTSIAVADLEACIQAEIIG